MSGRRYCWLFAHSPQGQPSTVTPLLGEHKKVEDKRAEDKLNLTNREREVLLLVCKGLSNEEIAKRLIVTTHTVKKHLANVYLKLGVIRRAQAIAMAHQLGII